MFKKNKLLILGVISGVGTSVSLLLMVLVLISSSSLAKHNCLQIEAIKGRIRTSVSQSDKILGKPGSPGYAYYHQHPDELAATHTLNHKTVSQFSQDQCK